MNFEIFWKFQDLQDNVFLKEKFFDFVASNRKENQALTEEFVFNQLPSFINYLAEL